jgi:hypothetical protein
MPRGMIHEKTAVGALRGARSKKQVPTAIEFSLEEGGPLYLTMQQVRANFTRVCNGKRAVVVGNRYNPRAVILPCGSTRYLSGEESAALVLRIKAMCTEATKLL